MPTTLINAFNLFLKEVVNLDSDVTKTARASRNWLFERIGEMPSQHPNFPRLYQEVDIHYGSFARRTKIRELDDIDLIVGISALGSTYLQFPDRVELAVPDGITLRNYCHDGTNLLNSRKVINLFIEALRNVPQYRKSELKRNGSAAVLNLTSYSWVFDIVPAFFTTPEFDGRTYYLIPDGHGHWKKTDPRIDQERVTGINQNHDGKVLNILRTFKYWNRRANMPTIPSYLAECLVLDFFSRAPLNTSEFVDMELPDLWDFLAGAIRAPVLDPKQIDGNINTLSWDERVAISNRAASDAKKAREGRLFEQADNMMKAIDVWRDILGDAFPTYG
jgi:hypothetical protein